MHFCILHRILRWLPDMVGKRFLAKSPKDFVKIACLTPFAINTLYTFYEDFQDGHQKWWENNFW